MDEVFTKTLTLEFWPWSSEASHANMYKIYLEQFQYRGFATRMHEGGPYADT